MELREIVGISYLIYGLIKVCVGLSLIILPSDILKKIPAISKLGEHKDTTLAGKMYEYVFLIFGFYTVLVGLSLLHVFNPSWRHYFEQRQTEYAVVLALGAFLVAFYVLVLYTDVPISKNPDNRNYYLLLGLGGGLSFMLLPILWEATMYFNPWFRTLRFEQKSMVAIGLAIAIVVVADCIYSYMQRNKLDTIIVPAPIRTELQKLQTGQRQLFFESRAARSMNTQETPCSHTETCTSREKPPKPDGSRRDPPSSSRWQQTPVHSHHTETRHPSYA
jgi:hypothetical protein